jgi:hypothetical protein
MIIAVALVAFWTIIKLLMYIVIIYFAWNYLEVVDTWLFCRQSSRDEFHYLVGLS